jgi:hypothetical protein
MYLKTSNKIFFIALIGMIYSCREKDPIYPDNKCDSNCITFKGKVYDKNNDKPVDGVKITIEYDDKLILSDIREIGTTYTNLQGDFSYTFPGDKLDLVEGEFIIKATKSGYLSNSQVGIKTIDASDSIRINENKIVNFDFFPIAYLEIKIQINKPENISSLNCGYNHCNFDYGYGISFWKPNFTDKTIKYDVPGDGCIHFGYSGTSLNGDFSDSEDYSIKAGELKIYEIKIE